MSSNCLGNVGIEDHLGKFEVDLGGVYGEEDSKGSLGKGSLSIPLGINMVGIQIPVSIVHKFKLAQQWVISVKFDHHFSSLDVGDVIVCVNIELPGWGFNHHVDFVAHGVPCGPVKGDGEDVWSIDSGELIFREQSTIEHH